jgi:AmmeMemoRadiSam system protein B
MLRKPAVAGYFYPSDSSELFEDVRNYTKSNLTERNAIGIVSPHAGYMYSGQVAGRTFSAVKVTETVIVIGPNHTGMGSDAAIVCSGKWAIPGAEIEINSEIAERLLQSFDGLEDDSLAHLQEHSLEVQLPFLYHKNKNFKLVPICLAHNNFNFCNELGKSIGKVIKNSGENILIVASSDMTHYEPHDIAKEKDKLAINEIVKLSPRDLYNVVNEQRITMCGVIPAVTMLCAAKELGAKAGELIQYQTSGETSGDYSQVVGYAGIVVY